MLCGQLEAGQSWNRVLFSHVTICSRRGSVATGAGGPLARFQEPSSAPRRRSNGVTAPVRQRFLCRSGGRRHRAGRGPDQPADPIRRRVLRISF